jgi:hypothetical protein
MSRFVGSRIAVMSVCLLAGAAAVAAAGPQGAAAASGQGRPAEAQQGPLVVEPISSGFVIAPDFRFTKIDGSNHVLAGAYGGWLHDQTFLLGAGGYWLADPKSHGTRVGYGGFVAGMSVPVGSALQVGARGLFGMGQARMFANVTVRHPDYFGDRGRNQQVDPGFTVVQQQVRFNQNFLVFEPQATAALRFGGKVSLDFGGGYRFIGDAGGWDRQLRGGFGSVGVRFGPF